MPFTDKDGAAHHLRKTKQGTRQFKIHLLLSFCCGKHSDSDAGFPWFVSDDDEAKLQSDYGE